MTESLVVDVIVGIFGLVVAVIVFTDTPSGRPKVWRGKQPGD